LIGAATVSLAAWEDLRSGPADGAEVEAGERTAGEEENAEDDLCGAGGSVVSPSWRPSPPEPPTWNQSSFRLSSRRNEALLPRLRMAPAVASGVGGEVGFGSTKMLTRASSGVLRAARRRALETQDKVRQLLQEYRIQPDKDGNQGKFRMKW
jgi:hypothetical protein